MKKYLNKIIIIFLLIFMCPMVLYSQDSEDVNIKKSSELFYTFLGPVIGGGFNNIVYNDWFIDERDTKELSGNYFSGGFIFNIFADNLIGDFNMQYIYNVNENSNIYHLFYSLAGKYQFKIAEIISLTLGLGIYLETPPSNEDYNGSSGGQVLGGIVLDTTFDTKLIVDFICRYGYYGLGEDSTKLSYGMNLGFMFKIGRI